eukprot:353213-Chlamydomonas_euryale.AAC.1
MVVCVPAGLTQGQALTPCMLGQQITGVTCHVDLDLSMACRGACKELRWTTAVAARQGQAGAIQFSFRRLAAAASCWPASRRRVPRPIRPTSRPGERTQPSRAVSWRQLPEPDYPDTPAQDGMHAQTRLPSIPTIAWLQAVPSAADINTAIAPVIDLPTSLLLLGSFRLGPGCLLGSLGRVAHRPVVLRVVAAAVIVCDGAWARRDAL